MELFEEASWVRADRHGPVTRIAEKPLAALISSDSMSLAS